MGNLPYLWIVAGPNGAGKTTLAQIPQIAEKLQSAERLNPDEVSKELLYQRGGFNFQTASPEMLQATFIEAATECRPTSWLRAGSDPWNNSLGSPVERT